MDTPSSSPRSVRLRIFSPILTSEPARSASIPEVVGEAGILLDPRDVPAWTDAIVKVVNDEHRRVDLRACGVSIHAETRADERVFVAQRRFAANSSVLRQQLRDLRPAAVHRILVQAPLRQSSVTRRSGIRIGAVCQQPFGELPIVFLHGNVEQEARAREAVADERARMARELHDIVGHALNLIVIQAAGAQRVFDARPEVPREALASIEIAPPSSDTATPALKAPDAEIPPFEPWRARTNATSAAPIIPTKKSTAQPTPTQTSGCVLVAGGSGGGGSA